MALSSFDQRVDEAASVLTALSNKYDEFPRTTKCCVVKPPGVKRFSSSFDDESNHIHKRRRLQQDYYHQQEPHLTTDKHHVRFQDEVDVQTHTFERVEEDNMKNVWWTKDEIGHIHRRERSMVSVLTCFCDVYVAQLNKLMDVSASDNANGIATPNDEEDKGDTCHLWLANNQGRGLESQVAYLIGNPNRASKFIRKFLGIQNQIRHFLCSKHGNSDTSLSISSELQTQILCTQSQRLSHQNIQFALLMGVGDAHVARSLQPEED